MTALELPGPLVSETWLKTYVTEPNVKPLDASWYLPNQDGDAEAEFHLEHIEGAVFFDIDKISDGLSSLPHMLPKPKFFSKKMVELGLSNDDIIIIYDRVGIFSSPRAWWTFRVFGHKNVAILDGGLPNWKNAGLPLTSGRPTIKNTSYQSNFNSSLIRDVDQIISNLQENYEQVVDARSHGRFHGSEPEPRPNLRSGHIPNSVNLPYGALIDQNTNLLLSTNRLKEIFEELRIDLTRPIITTCGSGISASLLALALYVCGNQNVAVYDGSWTEWGGRKDTPISL